MVVANYWRVDLRDLLLQAGGMVLAAYPAARVVVRWGGQASGQPNDVTVIIGSDGSVTARTSTGGT